MIAGRKALTARGAPEARESEEAAWAARTMRIVSTASRGGRAHRAGIVAPLGPFGPSDPSGPCAPASRNAVSASLDARKRDLTLIFKRKRPHFFDAQSRGAQRLWSYAVTLGFILVAQRPRGPTASRPNGPTASRPNGPTAQRPNGPTFISSAGTLSQQWSCLSLLP